MIGMDGERESGKSVQPEWLDPIYPTPPLAQDMTHGQFLRGV